MQKKLFTIVTLAIFSVVSLTVKAMDVDRLAMAGRKLNAQAAAGLEQQLANDPQNVALRTKLLGYYSRNSYQDPAARRARNSHILWLIANKPESEVLALPYANLNMGLDKKAYEQAKKLWLNYLKSPTVSLKILKNAAAAFMLFDKKLAEAALKRAQVQEPKNPDWALKLGHLYLLQVMANRPAAKSAAAKALQQFTTAYQLSSKDERSVFLQYIAKAALVAGQIEQAQKYAKEMLSNNPKGWNYGNNIYYANIILGEIALQKGDIAAAKQYLIKAGKSPGSPQLDTFGPSMALAEKLLKRGECDTVLQYFKLCGKFWEGRGGKLLAQWTETVKAGKIPKFGVNLFY